MTATDNFFGRDGLALGPCYIDYDTGTGGAAVDLGGFDSVQFKFGVTKTELKYDKYGAGAANKVVTADECSIQVGLAQATLERMAQTIQGFRVNTDTDGVVTGYSFESSIGQDDLSIAKQLTLTLQVDGAKSTDPNDKIYVWKAVPSASVDVKFDAASQRFVGVMFTCYKDDSVGANTAGNATYFGSGAY